MMRAIAFRGHTLLPEVSVKNKPWVKLSPLHQGTVWVFFLSGVSKGQVVCLDNLYNSVSFSHMLEIGETFIIKIPAGWTADLDGDGKEDARIEEYTVEGVHIDGTWRVASHSVPHMAPCAPVTPLPRASPHRHAAPRASHPLLN